MTAFEPTLVSEREADGSWEDCTWASGVMLANSVEGADKYPGTRREYESLRVAGGEEEREGDGDGSHYGQLEVGLAKRYELYPFVLSGAGAVQAIPVGAAAAVQGLVLELPPRLQITGFRGAHSVFVIRRSFDVFLWFDPLRAKGAKPVLASLREVQKYFEALRGAKILAAFTGQKSWRDVMIRLDFARFKAVQDAPVYEAPYPGLPRVALLSKGREVTSIGVPMDRSTADGTPFLSQSWRAITLVTGAIDGKIAQKVVFVEKEHLERVATSDAWDQALLQALVDPTFRGPVEIPVPDPVVTAERDRLRSDIVALTTLGEKTADVLREAADALDGGEEAA